MGIRASFWAYVKIWESFMFAIGCSDDTNRHFKIPTSLLINHFTRCIARGEAKNMTADSLRSF